jgi:hypothetical protein
MRNGLTDITEGPWASAIWAEDGAAVRSEACGLLDATAAADRQQPRGLAAAEDHGLALVGQPKQGSWLALGMSGRTCGIWHRELLICHCPGAS